MSSENEIERPNARIEWPDLESTMITLQFRQSARKWRSFIESMDKSGSVIGRAIAEVAKEAIAKIDERKK